jgi:hypothetical protein
VAFWVDALFHFMATPVENSTRLRVLTDAVHGGHVSNGVLLARLEALLGLLALLGRVVLVADNLDGFSSDESAALKFAAFLGALRQSVGRLDVILSLNQDIWESAFVPRLSGGLSDRLTEVVIELKPLADDEMLDLLEARVPGLGKRVFDQMDRTVLGQHARGLIRAAGVAWLRASAMDELVIPKLTVASPFQIVTDEAVIIEPPQAGKVSGPDAPLPTEVVAEPPVAAAADRVDGMLREFLDRYGPTKP